MRYALMFPLAVTLLAAPALATEPATLVTPKDVSAADVITTPAADLNLKRTEIPALLAAAAEEPYSLAALAPVGV